MNGLDERSEMHFDSASASPNSAPHKPLSYRKLRAPKEHGESLQIPPLAKCKLQALQDVQIRAIRTNTFDFAKWSQRCRRELVEKATQFSGRYRNIDTVRDGAEKIIMAGHQPTLFHPGVWFKNFSLAYLGKKLNATAINLVVDNDICNSALIRIPVTTDGQAQVSVEPIDAAGLPVPFEMRKIQDVDQLKSFAIRAAAKIRKFVDQPVVEKLWRHLAPEQNKQRLGQTLATGRHALEGEYGLNTLEIPLSELASTPAFAIFIRELLTRIEEFQNAYNDQLKRYRKLHRIRSRSHPVPELGVDNEWWETPFWVWSNDSPLRSGLYVRATPDGFELSNQKGLNIRFNSKYFVSQLLDANERGEFIVRPRALITTMYSRLMLSDLFLHGIGGAKYDQLTDAIACQFFGVKLPEFVTLTATMKLPTSAPDISKQDLTRVQTAIRDLEFHPELYVNEEESDAQRLIETKRSWIDKYRSEGSNKERHDAITQANAALQPYVTGQRTQLQNELDKLQSEYRNSQILRSREYSFALFPESLVEHLQALLPQSE